MKLNFSFIKTKKIHKVTSTKVREFINPTRDWFLGLAAATIFFVVGATYIGIDLYTQFNEEPAFTQTGEASITYDKNVVIEYAGIYADREANFNTLRTKRPITVPDVSVSIPETEVILPEISEEPSFEPSKEAILQ